MYQYQSHDDTIAAIATPPGQGGIGIVRLSGITALGIADRIFKCKDRTLPSLARTYTVHYGWVVNTNAATREGQRADESHIVDEALLTVMRGPKSYTAQDVVEISCHGGPAVVEAVLNLALKNGARLAEPGEFTKRAFLNGRIDLAQAEAVLDVIRARSAAFARASQNQLNGELSAQLHGIRGELTALYITIEALINFPEDDIDAQGRAEIQHRLQIARSRVQALLDSAHNGRILKEGVRIVLCGKPNVGKSSLLNVLLKQDRAIVTDIAGTTRDVLEESAQINGVPVQLADTAGILEPRDLIEQEAVKRSHVFIDGADLVLLVLDASRPLEDADRMLIEKLKGRKVLCVLNKSDLPQMIDTKALPFDGIITISAINKTAIDALEQAMIKAVWQGQEMDPRGAIVSNIRHVQALTAAVQCLQEAETMMRTQTSWEFISQNVKDAINGLDAITGRNIDQDLLDRIFSEFCIGK